MSLMDGRTALVTGALGTIGQALVSRFATEGASVIALDLPGREEASLALGRPGDRIRYHGCDLNGLATLEADIEALGEAVGGIDILVNNAAHVINKPHEAFSIEEYEHQLRVNSTAAFLLSRACSKGMKAKRAGKIVNLTSLTLNGNWDGFVPYVASKGAMYGLVKALARELGPHGINVNGIAPGAVVSEAEARNFDDVEAYERWILDRQSLKRRIMPEDIASLAAFLCSAQSDLITGQNIHCDGGW